MTIWQFFVVGFVVGALMRLAAFFRLGSSVSIGPLSMFKWGVLCGLAGLFLGWLWNLA